MSLIIGHRIKMRPLERKDLQLKIEWINDPEVHADLSYEVPLSLARTEHWFNSAVTNPTRRDFMIESMDGQPIGLTGLTDINTTYRTAETYLAIGERSWWGKGIGTEAISLVCEWGFNTLDLYRINGSILITMQACLKLCLKNGFKEEGLRRGMRYLNGKRVDVIVIGLLRDEFTPYVPKDK